MAVKIVVTGAAGKMGKMIIQAIAQDPQAVLAGAVEVPGSSALGRDAGEFAGIEKKNVAITDNLESCLSQADVLIDFTSPESTIANLAVAEKLGKRVVIGTTGLSDEQNAKIKASGRSIAVVCSPNMSIGVNLLFKLVEQVTAALRDYDIEIIEAHHRLKKDSPSGTADKLARIIAETLRKDVNDIGVFGRKGLVGERRKGELGVHAVRGGDIVGDHTILFAGEGERIEIKHQAHSRMTFAAGAVRAARFLMGKTSGFYTMKEVLGL
jgi:4-hydroxy-tetrahydrodipicolinate reductase